jgi:hypothetical protein
MRSGFQSKLTTVSQSASSATSKMAIGSLRSIEVLKIQIFAFQLESPQQRLNYAEDLPLMTRLRHSLYQQPSSLTET